MRIHFHNCYKNLAIHTWVKLILEVYIAKIAIWEILHPNANASGLRRVCKIKLCNFW